MSLWFQPKPRSVLYCDFAGFLVPEMTKRRPVIVLRAHKRNRKLVYVVPLSTTAPDPPQPYHYRFAQSPVVHTAPVEAWAKCDMIAVVSTERLTASRRRHESQGRCKPDLLPKISEEEFAAIRRCVAIAFGFGAGSYVCVAAVGSKQIAVDVA